MIRKILSLILAFTLVFTVNACNHNRSVQSIHVIGCTEFDTKAINKYLQSNGKDYIIEYHQLQPTSYLQDVTQYVDGGGKVDLVFTGFSDHSNSFSSYYHFAANDLLVDLKPYLNTPNGYALYSQFSEKYWKSMTYNDGVFGVDGTFSSLRYVPTVISDYTINNILDRQTYLALIKQINQKEGETLSIPSYDFMYDFYSIEGYTYLTDTIIIDDESGRILSIWEDPNFIEAVKTYSSLNAKGALLVGDNADISYLSLFPMQNPMKPVSNVKVMQTQQINIGRPFYATGIYKNSNAKDVAFDLLVLLNTDPAAINAVLYGEEGINYTIKGGLVKRLDNQFHSGAFFVNQNLALKSDINDMYDDINSIYDQGVLSPNIGFYFDYNQLHSEIKAVNELHQAFQQAVIFNKSEDIHAELLKFQNIIKQSGIDEILREAKRQYALFYETKA